MRSMQMRANKPESHFQVRVHNKNKNVTFAQLMGVKPE